MKPSSRTITALVVLMAGIILATVGGIWGDFGNLMKYAIFVCLECMGIG